MDEMKHVLYRYNQAEECDEVALDLDGTSANYQVGEIIDRHDRSWKIDDLILTESHAPTELPILTVFLVDNIG
jgi:hypothetical protein